MSLLNHEKILDALEVGTITISDFDLVRLGSNSYDVRLGNWFYEVVYGPDGNAWYIGPQWYDINQRVSIPNGGTLLAMTMDIIGTFGPIVGLMKARSSTRRRAITVCDCAGLGDAGYHNHWTMELSGHSRSGTPHATVGQRIGQIAFFRMESETKKQYQGQYSTTDWPMCMVPKDDRRRIIANKNDIWSKRAKEEYWAQLEEKQQCRLNELRKYRERNG
jgi:dCTP deaminase